MAAKIFLLLLGFVLLVKGTDYLISGATSMAKRFKLSEAVIGATIVAFGTSMPELAVNLVSTAKNQDVLVFGNILGSNIFNVFVVLGVGAFYAPLLLKSSAVYKEIPYSFLATIILWILVNDVEALGVKDNFFIWLDGSVFVLMFAFFLIYLYVSIREEKESYGLKEIKAEAPLPTYGKVVLGTLGLVIGCQLVVDNSLWLIHLNGFDNDLFALSVISIGTSLPEMFSTIVAVKNKQFDIAVGNVAGSNIFNILLSLPICSFFRDLHFKSAFNLEIIFLLIVTLFLTLVFYPKWKLGVRKGIGGSLLLFYIAYWVIKANFIPA